MCAKKQTNSKSKRLPAQASPPMITQADLLKLGGGHIAFIKTMTPDQAKAMFPAIEGLPQGLSLYCLFAADGTPIALTDSLHAAIGHAMGDELELQTLH